MNISSFEILSRFQEKHSDLVRSMKCADHNYSPNDLNPYHTEGDVWTHTMMVFSHAANKNFPIEVQLAALLHDVGKAFTRNIQTKPNGKNYVSFRGHDGVSFYRAIDILEASYADVLNAAQIALVAKLVANHSVLYSWQNNPKKNKMDWAMEAFADDAQFLSLLTMLVESDACGRISEHEADIFEYLRFRDIVTDGKEINNDLPTLTLLIGPPACGKSTWVENNKHEDDVIISSDNIIEQIGSGKNYNAKWKSVDFPTVERMMMAKFREAVKARKNIIVDRTNMSKKSRRRFLSQLDFYTKKAVVFLNGHDNIMIRSALRCKTEGKSISSNIIHDMEKRLVYPLMDEFDVVEETF